MKGRRGGYIGELPVLFDLGTKPVVACGTDELPHLVRPNAETRVVLLEEVHPAWLDDASRVADHIFPDNLNACPSGRCEKCCEKKPQEAEMAGW